MPYYSTEDNVTDFDEFDPTPYGGGYDQALIYGRPLPPSDEICYNSSSTDCDFEYERPDYSAAEPFNPYGNDALSTEYSSYHRRGGGGRKPKPAERHDGGGSDGDSDHRRKKHGDDDDSDDDDDDDDEEKRRRRRHRRRGSEDDD